MGEERLLLIQPASGVFIVIRARNARPLKLQRLISGDGSAILRRLERYNAVAALGTPSVLESMRADFKAEIIKGFI